MGVVRYGKPRAAYRAFVEGYGSEPGDWQGFEVMCRLYELMVVSWAMRWAADSTRMAAEASLRLATLLGREDRRWTHL